jgi:hypothetical protein
MVGPACLPAGAGEAFMWRCETHRRGGRCYEKRAYPTRGTGTK